MVHRFQRVRLEELLDMDGEGLAEVMEYVPRFGMVIQDIAGVDDEELVHRTMVHQDSWSANDR